MGLVSTQNLDSSSTPVQKLLKLPYRRLARSSRADSFRQGLRGMLSGAIGWIRNSYTHEMHNLPHLSPRTTLELLFVASCLLRMLERASSPM